MTVRHFMLDLETLGTEADAAVLQVGACAFDPTTGGVLATFEQNVLLADKDQGRIDPNTLLWWMKQDPAVRAGVFEQGAAVSLSGSMLGLSDWMSNANVAREPVRIWANAPTFDCAIVRACFRRCGLRTNPWSFRDERCHRTLLAIGESMGLARLARLSAAHSALADAVHQAHEASAILQAISAIGTRVSP